MLLDLLMQVVERQAQLLIRLPQGSETTAGRDDLSDDVLRMAAYGIGETKECGSGKGCRVSTRDIAIEAALIEAITDRAYCEFILHERNIDHGLPHGISAA